MSILFGLGAPLGLGLLRLAYDDKGKRMRFASVRPEGLGIITDNDLILIGEILGREGSLPNGAMMVDLITRYDSLKPSLEKALTEGHRVNLVPGRLKAPVETLGRGV